jgi:hypothetical protein
MNTPLVWLMHTVNLGEDCVQPCADALDTCHDDRERSIDARGDSAVDEDINSTDSSKEEDNDPPTNEAFRGFMGVFVGEA